MENTEKNYQARRGGENRLLDGSGRPLVVIVEGQDIDKMMDAGLASVGGIGRIIGSHHRVVLKPNTNQRDPFPSITAPETLRAVARHCRDAGAKEIIVHEDHKWELDPYYNREELPGVDIQISHSPEAGHYVLVRHEAWHGDADADCYIKGVELRPPAINLTSPYEKTNGPCLRVARQLQEAPVIINLPVIKRHFAGQLTSALKNHFGSVYGAHRWIAHASLDKDRDYYDRKLVEFASAVRPEITITDARSIQAGFGPFREAATKIVKNVNRLIITGDMVAADAVAMGIMKEHDETFTGDMEAIVRRQFAHAEKLGLGISDLSKCELIELSV